MSETTPKVSLGARIGVERFRVGAAKWDSIDRFPAEQRPAASNVLDQSWIYSPQSTRYRLRASELGHILSVKRSLDELGYGYVMQQQEQQHTNSLGDTPDSQLAALYISADSMRQLKKQMPAMDISGGPTIGGSSGLAA